MNHEDVEFTIPARYAYRGARPGSGFGCERTMPVTLSAADTAVLCIHVTDHGYPGG